MAWRIVHIKEGDILRLRLDSIEIIKSDNPYLIPLSDISMVVLEGIGQLLPLNCYRV